MSKIFILAILVLTACNNSSNTSKESSGDSSTKSIASNWSKEDENEFLSGCVDNAKARFGEDTAYSFCHCVLGKVMLRFPNADSAANELKDSASAVEFTKDCD